MAHSSLLIQGIEVTQAIQYYRSHMHLADARDRAPDNAARLVAGKPAWVRVYVRSSGDALNDVTGMLRVERYAPESLLGDLNPQPPGTVIALREPEAAGSPLLTPATFYRWERSHLGATLNFVIPSSLMCGQLRLTARVSAPDGQTHERVTLVNVTLRQSIRFRANMLGAITQDALGNLVIVNPPTLADLQATSALTLQMYPVAAHAVYEIAATRYLSFPLGGNGCDGDAGWNQLQNVLDAAASADGNQQGCIYYGLIAPGVVGGGGCNWTTVAAGFAGHPLVELVRAHEIGHYFQAHAPCGNPGGVDLNYPTYEPYDPASIGEYGLNVNTGEVMSPETCKDIMAYCKPNQWVSLYGHTRRINQPLLNPEYVCVPRIDHFYPPKVPIDVTFPFVTAKPRPVVTILATQDMLGNVTVDDVFRSASYAGPPAAATTLVAVLEGADGQLLASGAMGRIPHMQCGQPDCGCRDRDERGPWSLKGVLPDVAAGSVLRILKDGQELWRRAAPATVARVEEVSADVIDDERLIVRWRGRGSGALQYWVQWSSDRGDTGRTPRRPGRPASRRPRRILLRAVRSDHGGHTCPPPGDHDSSSPPGRDVPGGTYGAAVGCRDNVRTGARTRRVDLVHRRPRSRSRCRELDHRARCRRTPLHAPRARPRGNWAERQLHHGAAARDATSAVVIEPQVDFRVAVRPRCPRSTAAGERE